MAFQQGHASRGMLSRKLLDFRDHISVFGWVVHRFGLERFLDFVRTYVWILAVFEEDRTLMVTDEFGERRRTDLPILWQANKVLKDRHGHECGKEGHRIPGVFVEVGVEDTLIHEVELPFDRKEHAAWVMQLIGIQETLGLQLRPTSPISITR